MTDNLAANTWISWSVGDLPGPGAAFETSSGLATEAGLETAALMAKGWDILSGRDAAEAPATIKTRLRRHEHGDFPANQCAVALQVFRPVAPTIP